MVTVVLTGKRELDIYINPQRQRLLRELALAGTPMTPKQLSGVLGISPSAVQHHIHKLVSLGVVGESHTEHIRGITAHFYQALPVTVRVGYGVAEGYDTQRLALIQNGINGVLQGFDRYLHKESEMRATDEASQQPRPEGSAGEINSMPVGDVLWGISRLTPQEAGTVMTLIRDFLRAHEAPSPNRIAWEYALIAYPVSEAKHA